MTTLVSGQVTEKDVVRTHTSFGLHRATTVKVLQRLGFGGGGAGGLFILPWRGMNRRYVNSIYVGNVFNKVVLRLLKQLVQHEKSTTSASLIEIVHNVAL